MKLTRAILTAVVLLAILVGTIWSLVHFVGLQASLIWTAIIAAGAWAVRKSIEQKREYQRLLADKKREQYLEFLDFLNHFVGAAGGSDQRPEDPGAQPRIDEISLEEFRKWSLRLTLIASDEVVRAWNTARLASPSAQDGGQDMAMMRGWGRLWLAMRKDCGHPDTQLKVTDIFASFVNDIEQHRSVLDAD